MPDTDDNETKSPSTETDEIRSETPDDDTTPRPAAATGSELDGVNGQNATDDAAGRTSGTVAETRAEMPTARTANG